jgi:ribonuclease Y
MELKTALLFVILAGLIGLVVGYALRVLVGLSKKNSIENDIKERSMRADKEAQQVILEAEEKAADLLKSTREDLHGREEKTKKTEERLVKKEEFLDKRQIDIDKEVEEIKKRIEDVRNIKEKAEILQKERQEQLEKTARMTENEAREYLINQAAKKSEEDLMGRIRKMDIAGEDALEEKAKGILATVVQRLAASVSADMFTSSVAIPSDDVKGKVIGKEGRNIKAFERETGVELLVDDVQGAITISSFDPVRRQIARVALENLIADGRIQPAKIEQFVAKAKEEINKVIKKKGEEAAYECGVINLDPRIISILGRLHFRTSYGQNVLAHSVEMSHIAGMLAEELGANVLIAKAGALLHDIGKAMDHEVQGTHVEIGRRILQKFGASEEIVKAMQAHHEEYPYETVESIIVQTADAISGGRPGARKDSVENYIKRLTELEGIATSFEGVEKAYALSAGREIRVFVRSEQLGDLQTRELARNIAVKIESDLKYPGEIRVVVIRENRAIEVAK